jgi:hypothetical protein
MKAVEVDFDISYKNLNEKLYTIPQLHSKYLNLLLKEKTRLYSLKQNMDKLYKKKYYFYRFEYDHTLDSHKEIQFHVEADDEFSTLVKNVNAKKALVEYLESVVKKAHNIGFDIKNILQHLQYMQGV